MKEALSWAMLVIGLVGFAVSFPLWLKGKLSERTMIGITLALSWAALWYSALTSLFVAK